MMKTENVVLFLKQLWRKSNIASPTPVNVMHSLRTGIGATTALVVSSTLHLPEPYWAPITTIIVMQSTLGASWSVSKQRFIGTIFGSVFASVLTSIFNISFWLFGVGLFCLGLICTVLRLDLSAYRFAGVTFSIVALVLRDQAAWLVGLHRFIEVSIGIAIGLALSVFAPVKPKS